MRAKGILAFMAQNSVAANILMVFLLIGGFVLLSRTVVEVFPELQEDMISIRVPYLGAAPQEVESGVILSIEEAISGVEGIDRINAVAQEGMATVVAELQEDADPQKVLDDIKAEVDRIETLPEEAEKPVISLLTNRRHIITLVLYGGTDLQTLKKLAEQVEDELTALESVSLVEITGVPRNEIAIEISEEALRRYHLSFDQVAQTLRQASLDLPGGILFTKGGEILLRTKEQKYTARDFGKIILLTTPQGGRIALKDVATLIDGFEESDIRSTFDGYPAVSLRIFRIGKQDALSMVKAVKDYVRKLKLRLPKGIQIALWEDYSKILKSRLSLLLRNARWGLMLVFCSLLLFLDLPLAFWVTLGIPIAFLGSFWIIPHYGVTINMVSLFAFILSLGLVVDDAIVVGENVYAYRQKGMGFLESAIRGVQEMAIPVVFAVLTTIAAFLPLYFTAGRLGKIMRQIPVVVSSVLFISLLEALFILPAHLAHTGRRGTPRWLRRIQDNIQNLLFKFIRGPYIRGVTWAVNNRWITIAIALSLLFITFGFIRGGHIKFTFMPRIDADNLLAEVEMPVGTPAEQTEKVVKKLEQAVRKILKKYDQRRPSSAPSILQHIASSIGEQPRASRRMGPHGPALASAQGGNIAEVNVELLSSEMRGIPSHELLADWRKEVGQVAGVKSLIFISNLFSVGEDINVELSHHNFAKLLKAVEKFKGILRQYPGVEDVMDTFEQGKKEFRMKLKPEGRNLGLTPLDVASQIRQAFWGAEVQRIQRGKEEIRVKVRYPRRMRESTLAFQTMRLRLPDNREIPFYQVAEVEEGRGYASLDRVDRRRIVTVKASVDPLRGNAEEINQELRHQVLPNLSQQYPGLMYSFGGVQREQKKSLKSLMVNFILIQLAIFGLLAIPLKSYIQPIIIMSAIPFGIIGAVLGHLIMGYDLSLLSMMGVVALTGVVVNDSLIMVDLINRERKEGIPLNRVVIDSATLRFRPILLTTLTTFLGLTPLILERSVQARFLIPMAVSLGFGVLFATTITLLLVPALYRSIEDIRGLFVRGNNYDNE